MKHLMQLSVLGGKLLRFTYTTFYTSKNNDNDNDNDSAPPNGPNILEN